MSALDSVLGVSREDDRDERRTTDEMIERVLENEASTSRAKNDDATEDENRDGVMLSTGNDLEDEKDDRDRPRGWLPWFSPRSKLYEVPTVTPKASYALALVHVLVFAGDFLLYKTGNGNGGDLLLRLAQVDDALIAGGQWLRPWTACLCDYGAAQFLLSTTALLTTGAEIEALLGTVSFSTIYACSSAAGVLAVTTFDPNTALSVGGSDAIFGVFGAVAAYSAVNAEPEWNPNGVAHRAFVMLFFMTGLAWIAGVPTLGAEHVVSNLGHSVSFALGAGLSYFGASPVLVSENPGPDRRSARRKVKLTNASRDSKDGTYVLLGVASGLLALESVLVVARRALEESSQL